MIFALLVALIRTMVSGFELWRILSIVGAGLIPAFIFAYDHRPAVKIVNAKVFGPSLSGSKQVEFELTSIDKPRTKQQSLWNKLSGQTIIYAKDGQKIQIDHTAFDKTKRAEILAALKLNEYP